MAVQRRAGTGIQRCAPGRIVGILRVAARGGLDDDNDVLLDHAPRVYPAGGYARPAVVVPLDILTDREDAGSGGGADDNDGTTTTTRRRWMRKLTLQYCSCTHIP